MMRTTTRFVLALTVLMCGVASAASPITITVPPRIHAVDANGVCVIDGVIDPGTTAALRCGLDHAERASLTATIETGSIVVQGWLLQASGREVLIALRNVSDRPITLLYARVTLGRLTPATPDVDDAGSASETTDACVMAAIGDDAEAAACAADTKTPAAATAGAD